MGSLSLEWKRRRRRTLEISSVLRDDEEEDLSGQVESSEEDEDIVKDIGDLIENHEHNLTDILSEEDNLFNSILSEGNRPSENSNSEISESGGCGDGGDIVAECDVDYANLLEELISSTSPDELTHKCTITDEIPDENLKLDEEIPTCNISECESSDPSRLSTEGSLENYDFSAQSHHHKNEKKNLNENATNDSSMDISSEDLPDSEDKKGGTTPNRDISSDYLPDLEEQNEGSTDISSDYLPDPEERQEESLLQDTQVETSEVHIFPKSDDPIYKNCTLQIPKVLKRESEDELSESLSNLVNKKIFRVLKKKRKIDSKEIKTDELQCTLKHPKIVSAECESEVSEEEEETLSDTEQIPLSRKKTLEKFRQVWKDERRLKKAGRSAPYKGPSRGTYSWQFRNEMNQFLEEEEDDDDDESPDLAPLPEGVKPFQYYKQVILQPSQSHIYDQDVITSLMSRKWEGGKGSKRKKERGKRRRSKMRPSFEALLSSDSDDSRCDSPDSSPECEDCDVSKVADSENRLTFSNKEGQLGCSSISAADELESQEQSDSTPLKSASLKIPPLIGDSPDMPVFDWS